MSWLRKIGLVLAVIVVTIGTMSLFRGIALVVLGDQAYTGYPPSLGDWALPGAYSVVDPYLLVFYEWGVRIGLDMATGYVRERTSFGRPLATNQGVSFPIAEHTTYLEAVRSLAHRTLGLRMAGRRHTREAAMLKWWAPRVAFAAVQEAVVLHGQVGWFCALDDFVYVDC